MGEALTCGDRAFCEVPRGYSAHTREIRTLVLSSRARAPNPSEHRRRRRRRRRRPFPVQTAPRFPTSFSRSEKLQSSQLTFARLSLICGLQLHSNTRARERQHDDGRREEKKISIRAERRRRRKGVRILNGRGSYSLGTAHFAK